MTAALPGRAIKFLRRVSVLAGIVAVIAGIFGMHIMTGSYSMPVSAAGQGADAARDAQASAAIMSTPDGAAAQGAATAESQASLPGGPCPAPDVCATKSAMGAVCILSPGNPPLAAPLPGITPVPVDDAAATSTSFSNYAYLPGSPSPGDLCISRT